MYYFFPKMGGGGFRWWGTSIGTPDSRECGGGGAGVNGQFYF